MREILFRGKSMVSEQWNYGYYAPRIDGEGKEQAEIVQVNGSRVAVEQESVGQYTGLTDKNGTKIFEGDICNFSVSNCGGISIVLRCVVTYRGLSSTISDSMEEKDYLESGDRLEVIGNIYDNPELLKRGE